MARKKIPKEIAEKLGEPKGPFESLHWEEMYGVEVIEIELDYYAQKKYDRSKKRNPELFEKLESMDENPAEVLAEEGHEIVKDLSEGNGRTRLVFQTRFNDGEGLVQDRVVKIPLEKITEESITAQRNTAAWKVGSRERKVSNDIIHPNLTRTIKTIKTPKMNVYNVELFQPDKIDLEKRLRAGNYSNGEFENHFKQILEAVTFLNLEKGILHRDIYPNNVLVPQKGKGLALLTDHENAESMQDIQTKYQPTKGGTSCTHPDLLMGYFGKPSRATPQTEVYSLGATMFFALTGSAPFEYAIKEDEEGTAITIGEEEKTIALFDGEQRLDNDEIVKEDHQKNLKQQLKKVPRKYREVIYKSLSLENDRYVSVAELKDEFNSLSTTKRLWSAAKKIIVPLIVAGSLSVPVVDRYADQMMSLSPVEIQPTEKEWKAPETREELAKMLNVRYTPYRVDSIGPEGNLRDYIFLNSFIHLKERLPKFLEEIGFSKPMVDRTYAEHIGNYATEFNDDMGGSIKNETLIEPHITAAWLIGGYLANEKKMKQEFNDSRSGGPTYRPKTLDFMAHPADLWMLAGGDEGRYIPGARTYLANLLNAHNNDVEQAFIHYYFEQEVIDKAKKDSNSDDILPVVRPDGGIHPGYIRALQRDYPERARTFINTLAILNSIEFEQGTDDKITLVKYKESGFLFVSEDTLISNRKRIEEMLKID